MLKFSGRRELLQIIRICDSHSNRVSSASCDRLHFGFNWPRGKMYSLRSNSPQGSSLASLREATRSLLRLPSQVSPFGNGRPKRRTEYLSPQSTEARSDRSKLISESMILLERALPKMLGDRGREGEREGSRNNNGRGRAHSAPTPLPASSGQS